MKKFDLVSYAMDFASFLVKEMDMDYIKSIILFGSVSRLEAEKDSDIDIFIDVVKNEDNIQENANKIKERFLNSVKCSKYWELLGIENNINVIAGKLEDWELESSIISNGLVLYGKYYKEPSKGRNIVLFVWENVSPETTRVMLNKKIFGYKKGKKFYNGLLQEYNGIKLGKGCIVVDAQFYNKFMETFRKYKVAVKIKKMLDYS